MFQLTSSDFNFLDKKGCSLCGGQEEISFQKKHLSQFKEVSLQFSKCKKCSVVYLNPRLSPESEEKLYNSEAYIAGTNASLGYYNYFSEEPFRRKTAESKMKAIEKIFPQKGKILEIGCAAGFFLSVANERGWEAYGIDISPAMIEFSQKKYGLKTFAKAFEDIPLGEKPLDKKFNVIACWGTTGTFVDPLANFKKIHELLEPNGIFIFNASNHESFTAKILGPKWYLLGPSSAHLYNRSSLTKLLIDAGFRDIQIKKDWYHLTLHKIFSKLPMFFKGGKKLAEKISKTKWAHYLFPLPNPGFFEVTAKK